MRLSSDRRPGLSGAPEFILYHIWDACSRPVTAAPAAIFFWPTSPRSCFCQASQLYLLEPRSTQYPGRPMAPWGARVKAFEPYVDHLEALVRAAVRLSARVQHEASITAALNGEPSIKLRGLVARDNLRKAGAFFTGAQLATRACAPALSGLAPKATIIDPACGAGDLLVACARKLPLDRDLETTLTTWGKRSIRNR